MEYNYLKNIRFLALVTAGYGLFILAMYLVVNHALIRSMEEQAKTVAEIVAIQATSARSVYSREVVKKLSQDGFGPSVYSKQMKGYVPIPAQFLKKIGLEASKNTAELFQYRPVSKWNLEPSQGLNNDFLRWAWPQLEKQDLVSPTAAIDWKAVSRVETDLQGNRFLRYLRADPAASASCVKCHNDYESKEVIIQQRQQSGIELGKQWKLHQLLGALYVNIPLEKIEAITNQQNRQTIFFIIGISLLAILLVSLFLRRLFKQGQSLNMLSHQASHDSLTGLVNRRGFERYIDHIYDENNDSQKVEHVLCLMDLDGFKQVNDTYGHQAGDDLLIVIANALQDSVRTKDVVARLGGDEFAIILDLCPLKKALEISSMILSNVCNSKIKVGDDEIGVSISIGVGKLEGDQNKLDEIIDAVDSACYAAKNNGKNQIFFVEGEEFKKYESKNKLL